MVAKAMKIRKVRHEVCVYWVSSRSVAEWYRVDMTARGGHGWCNCKAFNCRFNPNWKRLGGRHVPYMTDEDGKCSNSATATECAHIRVARERVEESFLRPLLAMMSAGVDEETAGFIRRVVRRAGTAPGQAPPGAPGTPS